MPVALPEELFELEGWGEDAIKNALAIRQVVNANSIFISRESDSAVTPRIELKWVVQGDTSQNKSLHKYLFPDEKRWAYDGFNGELQVMVVTNRGENQSHRKLLGKTRAALQIFVLNPYYMNGQEGIFQSDILNLANIWEIETEDSWTDEENCDYTQLKFGILFQILPSAWPQNL